VVVEDSGQLGQVAGQQEDSKAHPGQQVQSGQVKWITVNQQGVSQWGWDGQYCQGRDCMLLFQRGQAEVEFCQCRIGSFAQGDQMD